MSKNKKIANLRLRELRFAGGAMLLFSLLACEVARPQSAQTPQSLQAPQAQSQTAASHDDLTLVSIENLMNMEVTSVSKKEQKLSQVAAALYVITQEDIRRSGATNIPDLLRMVPGLDVAQIDANSWAISSRGFNLQFANKLLVLIDGRAVYTPLFGGVNWDTQDVPLEDIDRIEVVRGPGGTVWGANAVNGVINIITKKAADTQGGFVTGGGGTQAQEFGTLQYGGKIGQNTGYRIFAKYQNNNHFVDPNGQNAEDDWHLLHTGFRADTKLSDKDTLTTQGDLYTGREGAILVHTDISLPGNVNVQRVADLSGGNILGRWDHVFSSKVDTALQVYFDRYTRNGPESDERRDTFDLDFQNHLVLGSRQDLIWGIGFRYTSDHVAGTIDQAFLPPFFSSQLFNTFLQDQITLKRNRVNLYAGIKVENNYFTGFDLQPSARLDWTPTTRRTFWAAVSRASRTPSRRDIGLNAALAALPGPAEVVALGDSDFRSEHVIAYEMGYRAQPFERLSFGVATFFNVYHNLESIEPHPSFIEPNSNPPLLILPRVLGNELHGTTDGIEAYANWKVTNRWTLSPGYSLLQMHIHTSPGSLDTVSVGDVQGTSPTHQAQLRSRVELSRSLIWDANAYFVDRLAAAQIPAYTRLDTQLTWHISESAEFSVAGQNLLKDHHFEFNDFLQVVNSSQIKRSGYARITWRF